MAEKSPEAQKSSIRLIDAPSPIPLQELELEREERMPPPRNPDNHREPRRITLTQKVNDMLPHHTLTVKPVFKQKIQEGIPDPEEVISGPGLIHNWRRASGVKMRKRKSRKIRKSRKMRKIRKSRKMRMRTRLRTIKH